MERKLTFGWVERVTPDVEYFFRYSPAVVRWVQFGNMAIFSFLPGVFEAMDNIRDARKIVPPDGIHFDIDDAPAPLRRAW